MAEAGETGRRKTRMKVREAQEEILALLPEVEALAARFQAISDKLGAGNHTDRFLDSRPGPKHLRFWVANDASEAASELRRAAEEVRESAEETLDDLLASWEERQRRRQELINSEQKVRPPFGSLGFWPIR
jgi:uncharacterized coiled-coil DUF342 family protein